MQKILRFDVFNVEPDPVTVGHEILKIRPCVVISPDEMNDLLWTVIVAPLTSTIRELPFRVNSVFHGKHGQISIDQIKAVDKARLKRKLGVIEDSKTQFDIINTLQEMFAF